MAGTNKYYVKPLSGGDEQRLSAPWYRTVITTGGLALALVGFAYDQSARPSGYSADGLIGGLIVVTVAYRFFKDSISA
jgi:hypothetical protein